MHTYTQEQARYKQATYKQQKQAMHTACVPIHTACVYTHTYICPCARVCARVRVLMSRVGCGHDQEEEEAITDNGEKATTVSLRRFHRYSLLWKLSRR